ncbi:hypothetical protein DSCO28_61720 [Desulfosarcina ovata subsp. sediminis]|uniref:Uncharacterized protein n=1 Tax=Desulfosarcina ovata subsp. sediminis TaxID=885957 RepID=A0A5K7ZZL3_9BACT|nr:hypothetical protein DSCO28_61720 [Desulfosarcina ovata subsp. sediminis]
MKARYFFDISTGGVIGDGKITRKKVDLVVIFNKCVDCDEYWMCLSTPIGKKGHWIAGRDPDQETGTESLPSQDRCM